MFFGLIFFLCFSHFSSFLLKFKKIQSTLLKKKKKKKKKKKIHILHFIFFWKIFQLITFWVFEKLDLFTVHQFQVRLFCFCTPFTYCLFIEQYVHILSVTTCFCIPFNASCMYILTYIVFPSVYSVLVYHGYTTANISPWWVGIWLNILPIPKHSNVQYH